MKLITSSFLPLVFLLSGCQPIENPSKLIDDTIRFEMVRYFKSPKTDVSRAFQSRLTYYFDNGLPHRWIDQDSTGKLLVDYIYHYDSSWVQTGATYKEPDDEGYSIERVRFDNDSTQITEWLDSAGSVYYTMIDNLNNSGKSYRATFIGDTIHGYDSTFYTSNSFEERVFFTNNKGKVFNDRTFLYDSINRNGDWIIRRKVMQDSVPEIQQREIQYVQDSVERAGLFYPGIVSTAEQEENVVSFSKSDSIIFFTRTKDWFNQKGFLATRVHGVYTPPIFVEELDSIYNGAISPEGDRIIYATRTTSSEEIWLIRSSGKHWTSKTNLTATSGITGGYFNWITTNELAFYINANNGDIVIGRLENDSLSVIDSLARLNTPEGNEFSPFVDSQRRYIIFTRYLEFDKSQQGFFISYNQGTRKQPIWTTPKKIKALPYGWSAFVSGDQKLFIYTDGQDLHKVPLESLGLDL